MVPDYHIHSVFSPEIECKDRIEEIFEKCLSLGLTSFGISDHLHCEMNIPFLIKARMVYEKIKGDFPFYFGVEVSVLREYDIEENRQSENPSLYGYKEDGPCESPFSIDKIENVIKLIDILNEIGIKPEKLWRPENGRNKDLCFK